MVKIKKLSKYSKYFLFVSIAAVVGLFLPSKSDHSKIAPTIGYDQAHADVPNAGDDSSGDDDAAGDASDSDGGDA